MNSLGAPCVLQFSTESPGQSYALLSLASPAGKRLAVVWKHSGQFPIESKRPQQSVQGWTCDPASVPTNPWSRKGGLGSRAELFQSHAVVLQPVHSFIRSSPFNHLSL